MTHTFTSKITRREDQIEFIEGGKSIFTIENTQSQKRLTYRVDKVDTDKYQVSAFTGSDNTSKTSYRIIGWIVNGKFTTEQDRNEVITKTLEQGKCNTWTKGFLENIKTRTTLTVKQQVMYEKACRKNIVTLMDTDTVNTKSFQWMWNTLSNGMLPEMVSFYHEGMCCHCTRRLTVPASIITGYGPSCANNVGKGGLWTSLNKSFPAK